jgi:hypothetical protein
MNLNLGWFAVGVTISFVLGMAIVQDAGAYEYVASGPYLSADTDQTENSESQTHSSEASASADPYSYGYVTAEVGTYAMARNGDSAAPSASASAGWQKYWQWNGPAGTAPGGTLDWYCDASGFSSCWGMLDLGNSGEGFSVASGQGHGASGGSTGIGDFGYGEVFGYLDDSGTYTGDASADGPDGGNYEAEPYAEPGAYDCSAEWRFNIGDWTSIPSGTSYVHYSTAAICDTFSGAAAAPEESGAEARAWTSVDAHVSGSATFP